MARPKKVASAKSSPVAAAAESVKEKVTAAKAAAKKSEAVYVQVGGSEWDITTCKARVLKAYKAAGHRTAPKALNIYIKPEENKIYYVIDGENGSIDLQ